MNNPIATLGFTAEFLSGFALGLQEELIKARVRALALMLHDDVRGQKRANAEALLRQILEAQDEFSSNPPSPTRAKFVLHMPQWGPAPAQKQRKLTTREVTSAQIKIEAEMIAQREQSLMRFMQCLCWHQAYPQGLAYFEPATELAKSMPDHEPGIIWALIPGGLPTCRLLLSGALVYSSKRWVNIELAYGTDGSCVYYPLEKVQFKARDGLPTSVHRRWIRLNYLGPAYTSYYLRRADENARPFPFRLVATWRNRQSRDVLHEIFYPDVPGRGSSDLEPELQKFGGGVNLERLQPYLSNLHPWLSGGDYMLFTRQVDGEDLFWLVEALRGIHILNPDLVAGLPSPDLA